MPGYKVTEAVIDFLSKQKQMFTDQDVETLAKTIQAQMEYWWCVRNLPHNVTKP